MSDKYTTEIIETSADFDKRTRVRIRTAANAISIEKATQDGAVFPADIVGYAIVKIVNPHGKGDKEYNRNIFLTSDDELLFTGSDSLMTSFMEVWDEMWEPEKAEPVQVEFVQEPSKNREGKYYLKCYIR